MTARKQPVARPAETTTLALGAADFIAWRLGLPGQYATPIAMGIAAVPAAVTGLVTHGGVKGLVKAIWTGISPDSYGKA